MTLGKRAKRLVFSWHKYLRSCLNPCQVNCYLSVFVLVYYGIIFVVVFALLAIPSLSSVASNGCRREPLRLRSTQIDCVTIIPILIVVFVLATARVITRFRMLQNRGAVQVTAWTSILVDFDIRDGIVTATMHIVTIPVIRHQRFCSCFRRYDHSFWCRSLPADRPHSQHPTECDGSSAHRRLLAMCQVLRNTAREDAATRSWMTEELPAGSRPQILQSKTQPQSSSEV